ncbi:OLC1v1027119C1 [Oldenlandia corymbosa var. corymbosa]|uniref:OLC1v1027119C1 n=1 Tax=Oldenlandia corymbosa var. corymbosa TaxID=529605 RepID=A0AAV1CAY2_OLDCO|nr:OLC1v1027119C1 [Oldenlandia corymbosa var. corymbosa]
MPSVVSPQWQEKASGFFQSSGVKLREAGQSAGIFLEEVAKDAKGNVADVAEKVGSTVKSRWSFLQQPSTRHAMQERLITAAATTSMFLRKGFSETKDKVTIGKTKVEEVAKKTAQKSKTLLSDIERWQKGVASTDVFGVPIQATVQRQESTRPIPHILVKCADFLVLSGMNSQYLFKSEGDRKVVQHLVSLYNQDLNASLPEGVNPIDVAALMKCYLACLPEPLTTFELYNELKSARSSIVVMRNVLKRLPTVNYMTLELVTAVLLRVSQKSLLNKMDGRSLAMELAPVIMWPQGQRPEHYIQFSNQSGKFQSKSGRDTVQGYSNTWDMLEDENEVPDASSLIPLDDGSPVDYGAIDAFGIQPEKSGKYPLVVSTWPFKEAVRAAWKRVSSGSSAVDAVVEGCSACEELQCDGTVGPGGSPDENGETTIDAMIMDGVTMEVGAVAAMRYVKDGIKAAKLVMRHTKHTMLVGEQASVFAISMGLPGPTNLSSAESLEKWTKWKEDDCQPNFRKDVFPANHCGPYHPNSDAGSGKMACSMVNMVGSNELGSFVNRHNHDTIAMAVIDHMGHIAAGTSTNGATFKIPGRVGDGPIAGSSAYADAEVGACGATGDGDIMMRFLPCYQVVENMRLGMQPKLAAEDSISRIARKYPDFVGAVFALNKEGVHAGACHGWTFQYSVRSSGMNDVEEGNHQDTAPMEGESFGLSSIFYLDSFGQVNLTFNSDQLSWKSVDSGDEHGSSCCGLILRPDSSIRISDIYAVEFVDLGMLYESTLANGAGGCLLGSPSEMYCFKVHSAKKSKTYPSILTPSVHTFRHVDLMTCQTWVNRINASLNRENDRPKNLLVFVHPRSGKGNGRRTWEGVAPIFYQANIKAEVIVTERAGHAFNIMASTADKELNSYDGVIAVGGDGLFNELLNGLLLTRHKVPYPSRPADSRESVENDDNLPASEACEVIVEPSDPTEDYSPLLMSAEHNSIRVQNLRSEDDSCLIEHESEFSIPHERFRFGIIPAGSTDATVICTTGARDPVTSALQIVLGKRLSLDIAQVVRWKATSMSKDEPYVRYAANFAGYGFYGDVVTESEKYRWMGPKRYDYAGTKVFLQHRSYEAEIAYLEVEPEKGNFCPERGPWSSKVKAMIGLSKEAEKSTCLANCKVCNKKPVCSPSRSANMGPYSKALRWKKSKGRFLSVGAAVISCRNEKAPDGLVADAHLSDGFLHLILVRNCPRALYFCHLSQLAVKGGKPLEFQFVEHHKTPAFMFTAIGKESVWNVDGEILKGHQLSAQVFRGLVSLFASGPEA